MKKIKEFLNQLRQEASEGLAQADVQKMDFYLGQINALNKVVKEIERKEKEGFVMKLSWEEYIKED